MILSCFDRVISQTCFPMRPQWEVVKVTYERWKVTKVFVLLSFDWENYLYERCTWSHRKVSLWLRSTYVKLKTHLHWAMFRLALTSLNTINIPVHSALQFELHYFRTTIYDRYPGPEVISFATQLVLYEYRERWEPHFHARFDWHRKKWRVLILFTLHGTHKHV